MTDETEPAYKRATFLIRTDILEKLRRKAYWNRRKMKEVLEDALISDLKDEYDEDRIYV